MFIICAWWDGECPLSSSFIAPSFGQKDTDIFKYSGLNQHDCIYTACVFWEYLFNTEINTKTNSRNPPMLPPSGIINNSFIWTVWQWTFIRCSLLSFVFLECLQGLNQCMWTHQTLIVRSEERESESIFGFNYDSLRLSSPTVHI